MAWIVLLAEAATFGLMGLFCVMLSDGMRGDGAFFEIPGTDGVGRALIRSAQIALLTGLGGVAALTAFGQLA